MPPEIHLTGYVKPIYQKHNHLVRAYLGKRWSLVGSRFSVFILTLMLVATVTATCVAVPRTAMISSEAVFEDVQLLFPDLAMSTKSNSTVLAQDIAGRLALGNATGVSDDVYDPFEDARTYYSVMYGPLIMRAPPRLQYFDDALTPDSEHVLTTFFFNQSDLLLVYGSDHPDAPLLTLILDTSGLNATGEGEAAREVASLDIAESLGVPIEMTTSVIHTEDNYSYTVILSGEANGTPLSWCNLVAVEFSKADHSIRRVQVLPFVTVEQTYFSLTPEEASETCEQAIEDELAGGDSYQDSELKSVRLVLMREVVQGEEVDEYNTTQSEVFTLRLGYEFVVTVNDGMYSADYYDLVVVDCNDGSALFIVYGPVPISARSPIVILLPSLIIIGFVILLFVLFVHFETSPEFAVLLFQSFLLPIYMRISGARVLDSFSRGRIFEHVRMYPGSSFSGLKGSLGMGNGTLAYHLSVLQRLELVQSEKDGRERRYFICGVTHKVRPDMWLGKTEARVLEELVAKGPVSASTVAANLEMSRQRVHYNMRLLLKHGLAVHERPLWRAVQDGADGGTQEG